MRECSKSFRINNPQELDSTPAASTNNATKYSLYNDLVATLRTGRFPPPDGPQSPRPATTCSSGNALRTQRLHNVSTTGVDARRLEAGPARNRPVTPSRLQGDLRLRVLAGRRPRNAGGVGQTSRPRHRAPVRPAARLCRLGNEDARFLTSPSPNPALVAERSDVDRSTLCTREQRAVALIRNSPE